MENTVKKARSAWLKTGRILLVVLLIFIAFLLVRNIGTVNKLSGTMEASVFTETGEVLRCPVEIRGSLTHYPLKGDEADLIDSLSVWTGDRMIVEFEHQTGETGYAYSYRYTGVMNLRPLQVFAELDMKLIDPAKEGIRCVVAVPAVASEADAVSMLREMDLYEDAEKAFRWLWGE